MKKALMWLAVALVGYFGLPLVIYCVAMFVTWGAFWSPAEWDQGTRGMLAVFWSGWAFLVTMFFMEMA